MHRRGSISAADLSSSSTPEAAGDVQAYSPAAEAGVGEGEGGAGEGQQGSHEEDVVEGGSGAGVPVIKPAPVYNKEGVVVEDWDVLGCTTGSVRAHASIYL